MSNTQGTPMRRSSDKTQQSKVTPLRNRKVPSRPPILPSDQAEETAYLEMKLTTWDEIWASLTTARTRGNGEMIPVFYETLFKEAVFDDRGAWSLERRRLH
jgi:hypothetical protein